jgi:regulatory protein
VSDCYLAAMRILRYRFNSEGELRRKLARKKFEQEEIDSTIAQLQREKWLDDERFAGAFVRTRANKRHGRGRILRELHATGVARETAGKAVADNLDAEREREALRELLARRARILVRRHGAAYLASSEARNKLAVYLLNHGYDAALVYEALKEIRVADHQPDS